MSHRTYVPCRGDVVHFNASPSAGHEMAGPHFALVLSPSAYAKSTGMAIILIGTSKFKSAHPRYAFISQIPKGVIPPTKENLSGEGFLLCDCVRQIDWRERGVSFVGKAPKEFVEDALDKLLAAVEEPEDGS